jgi:hypothetical protein
MGFARRFWRSFAGLFRGRVACPVSPGAFRVVQFVALACGRILRLTWAASSPALPILDKDRTPRPLMPLLDEKFLWASLIWGALGTAYLVYGSRQKEPVPAVGGLLVIAASYLIGSWLLMSIVGLATLALVHFLLRRGW